jgi:hypothetical protein
MTRSIEWATLRCFQQASGLSGLEVDGIVEAVSYLLFMNIS